MCLPQSKRKKDTPYTAYVPNIPNFAEIIGNLKENTFLEKLPEIYKVPLFFLTLWAVFYSAIIFLTSDVYEIWKSQNITLSGVSKYHLVSSRVSVTGADAVTPNFTCTLAQNGTLCYQDAIEWAQKRLYETAHCCVFRLPIALTIGPVIFNYFISNLVWDVRHLKQGLEAGNLLSLTFFILTLAHTYLDTASDMQPDWIYTFPALIHFFMLSSSFSTVILLNEQLSACLRMKRPKGSKKVVKSALLFRSFGFLKLVAMLCVFIGINLAFILTPLHPPWYLEWCVDFCWLTNRWIFFAFYASTLSLYFCILLAAYLNVFEMSLMARESFIEPLKREEPLNSLIIALNEHFYVFVTLYLIWLFGTCVNYINSDLLWEAYSLIILLQTLWYMSKPLEKGFYNVFITPFSALQERFWEYMAEHKEDIPIETDE